jgi:hypothetical protein
MDIVRGKTKPRIVSWFTWTLLTTIACAASLADRQYPSAALMFCATIETLAIVIMGWKYGDRKFNRLDIICQIGALIGLLLWSVFNSPAVAVIATITIDLVGALPSIQHSWATPYEETWSAYCIAGIAGLLTVIAADKWSITAIAYPIYIVVINAVFVLVLIARKKYAVAGEPAELREL